MDKRSKVDPETEFASHVSWPIGDLSDGVYGERGSSILGDFGWDFPPTDDINQDSKLAGRLRDFESMYRSQSFEYAGDSALPMENSCEMQSSDVALAAASASASASASNRPSSSSSSEDRSEKKMGSGGNQAEIQSKVRKRGQKRTRQQRFAFLTKSDIDHLEDGYRWRKYGQKAVKNSPFPRSYYRCTNGKCTVKKRVERSSEDPTIVVTTYEGQHCHYTAGFSRSGVIAHAGSFDYQFSSLVPHLYYPELDLPPENPLVVTQLQTEYAADETSNVISEQTPMIISPDQGLLGDIVPSGIRKR